MDYKVDQIINEDDRHELIDLYNSIPSSVAHQDYNLYKVDKRILKSQQMRDELEDKQILIDELESKQNLVKDQMKIQKEGNDMLQKKIDQLYNNNILIPKEGKDDSKERDDQPK